MTPAPTTPNHPSDPTLTAPIVSTSFQGIDPHALVLGIGTYVIWGFFPLYFHLLAPAGAFEVIVHRAVWGLLTCLLTLTVLRRLPRLVATLHDREMLARLGTAGALIVINWTAYVYAVQSGHTTDAALGYFINPLVTVALAAVFLRERITHLQKAAVALGALAVLVLVSLDWFRQTRRR